MFLSKSHNFSNPDCCLYCDFSNQKSPGAERRRGCTAGTSCDFSTEMSLQDEWQLWDCQRNPHPPRSLTSEIVFISLSAISTGEERRERNAGIKRKNRVIEAGCQRVEIFHPTCISCGRILTSVHNLELSGYLVSFIV